MFGSNLIFISKGHFYKNDRRWPDEKDDNRKICTANGQRVETIMPKQSVSAIYLGDVLIVCGMDKKVICIQ